MCAFEEETNLKKKQKKQPCDKLNETGNSIFIAIKFI